MAQSLAKLHLHLVFSTKHREPLLTDPVRAPLHRYLAGVFERLGCPAKAIGSVEDHIHVLFELSRTKSVCAVVETVKASSSRWLRSRDETTERFAWQAGYGVFAVSASNMPRVCNYIANQREHHRLADYRHEYRALLERHRVTFDERHVWD
jgi:REP element-mobilizing transposase RayT